MEIEAKFMVPDAALLDRLAAAPSLAGYVLGPAVVRRDDDLFYDTADGGLRAAGLYLRRRVNADGVRVALKQLAPASGGVLRREGEELLLTADLPVREWPDGPLKTRVRAVAGDADLTPVLRLTQVRRARDVTLGEGVVAELSLDAVSVRSGPSRLRWHEAEVEIVREGTEEDLAALGSALEGVWGLRAERRSKFEHALALEAD